MVFLEWYTAEDSFCGNSSFTGGGLSLPTNVTGCSNSSADACSTRFHSNSYDFNSETDEPKCGHQNSDV